MRHYLRHIYVKRYGALADRTVGPFGSGLNVVFGPNETGKSTVASFVGGVLFGWEDAHGVRNTYQSQEGGRAGALTFAPQFEEDVDDLEEEGFDLDGLSGTLVLFRGLDGLDGVDADPASTAPAALQGPSQLIADIDRNTYKTMFSLTADELRTLRNSSDVTARLLTASAGTESSPVSAFLEIEQRIAALTSPDPSADGSITRLAAQLEEKRAEVREQAARHERYKQEDRELRELVTSRADAFLHVDALNRESKALSDALIELESNARQTARCQADLADIQAERADVQADLAGFQAERASLSSSASADLLPEGAASPDVRLLSLDAAAERVLRDKLDEFDEERGKVGRVVDIAKENSATSTAAYEALVEMDEGASGQSRLHRVRNRSLQLAVSVIPTLAFIVAGVLLFAHGRSINSLSFTALGTGLVGLAFFLAFAAIVALVRSPRDAPDADGRLEDARWVMLQDKRKLAASMAESDALEARIAACLSNAGLGAADGSLRQARLLLDEAREARARIASNEQRIASIDLRVCSLEGELAELSASQRRIASSLCAIDPALASQPPETLLSSVEETIREKVAQRDALREVLDGMSQRYGELKANLDQARSDDAFDRCKLECQQMRARLKAGRHELVELLLAKRILERSISAWEGRNQSEVYAEASRLLALITDGAWVQVSVSTRGSIVAKRADGTTCGPRHLSLGACQQLYLALRIALLLSAHDVGKAVPVLADDILVNFDAARRRSAARALAELARARQVIVFTCHEETVAALREADPGLSYLPLE